MITISEIKERLSNDKQQREVVEMLIKAEELRRQVNAYLQADKNANMNELRRETLADVSEDLYQMEFAFGKVLGMNIAESVMNQWK